jgi:hypothetical protein
VSDLIARRDGVIVLLDDGPQTWQVLARNVRGNLPSPDPQDAFEIRSADERIGMRNVMWLYQGMNLQPQLEPVIQQLSLGIASDNPGYDDLAALASSSPFQVEEVVALAVAYTDSSGTDVTQKRIWTDRERFVPGLTDPGLRSFFETRDQR